MIQGCLLSPVLLNIVAIPSQNNKAEIRNKKKEYISKKTNYPYEQVT
jgi:hypothetical protein